jgi:hypothetical protein
MIPPSAKKFLTGCAGLALAPFVVTTHAQSAKRPNILVIWGDDIGGFNISAYNQGMMYITRTHAASAEWACA